MKRLSLFLVLAAVILANMFSSCSPEFEVYAPERNIRAIYAVLTPTDSFQYIRVSQVFQVRSDAEAYAGETDLSIQGLNVRLTRTDVGFTYQAEELDSFRKDTNGIFYTYQTIYRVRTDGSPNNPQVLAGKQYRLEIGTPENGDYNYALTTIPAEPQIRGQLSIQSGPGNSKCLPRLDLYQPISIAWEKSGALAYELSMKMRYERNGVPDSLLLGPTNLIEENVRCSDGNNRICYQYSEEQILVFLKRLLPQDGTTYTYDKEDSCVVNPTNNPTINARMPVSVEFKVSGVDEFLYRYMVANDPRYGDLTGAKPEYSNIEGDVDAVGVFGSVNTSKRYALFNRCSEYALRLNGASTPPPGCPQ